MKNSRREFLVGAGVAAGVAAAWDSRCREEIFGAVRADEPSGKALDPDAALKKLMEGNARFVKGQATADRAAAGGFQAAGSGRSIQRRLL